MAKSITSSLYIFRNNRLIRILILVLLFLGGLGIRLYDISDLPLDFHPTRQLYTAIVARGRYYENLESAQDWQRELAVRMWRAEGLESPVIDSVAAISYGIAGEEDPTIARVESSIFWVLGGIALFLLASEMTSFSGGLLALVFYLFAPYAVISSRSFQPDPLTTSLSLWAFWGMWRWGIRRNWKWVLLIGLTAGFAIFTKALAVFPVLGGFLGLLAARGFKHSLRDIQFWTMGLLAVLPTFAYMVYGFLVAGSLGDQFALRFFPSLWLDPVFYLRWETMIERVVGIIPFCLSLIGFFLLEEKRTQRFLLGPWLGYALFGFAFAYYFITHDYYHMSLIPAVALGLAPLGAWVGQRLAELNQGWFSRVLLTGCILFGIFFNIWNIRTTFHKTDYRPELGFWQHISEVVGRDNSILALTQDYGYRMEYYAWLMPAGYWPYTGDLTLRDLAGMDQPGFESMFMDAIEGRDLFVITDLEELSAQPQLTETLAAGFAIFDQGEGYMIYDLNSPLQAP